jgi:hypothetical protein
MAGGLKSRCSTNGMPAWTPEELEFLQWAEGREGRPLTEPEKRLWVAQARMIGDL